MQRFPYSAIHHGQSAKSFRRSSFQFPSSRSSAPQPLECVNCWFFILLHSTSTMSDPPVPTVAPAPPVAPTVSSTKTVLITGGNRGLGLALVQAFAATPGWSVMATARNVDTLPKELCNGGTFALDLNHASHIDNLVHLLVAQQQQHPGGEAPSPLNNLPIDVLIHNAGFNPKDVKDNSGYFESTFYAKHFSAQNVAESCRINALHPMELTGKLMAAVSPQLLSDTAIVIGISSWLGSISKKDFAGHYGYAGSKALFNMCLKGLALEMETTTNVTTDPNQQPQHRCCIALNPGWMTTDMGGPNAERSPDDVAKAVVDMVMEEGYLKSQNGKFLNADRTEHEW